MKKFLMVMMVVCLLTFASSVSAQTWYPTNQATVAWDAVPPLATGDTIKYQVYTRMGTTGDGTPVGGEITATQLAITFSVEGRYYVGVKTIRYPQGETVGTPSAATAWSNIAADCAAAGPFGIVYYLAPITPKGLRPAP